MERLRILDLYAGAGGAAAGYVRAGFAVTGVDIKAQPRYLLSGASEFVQGDAIEFVRAHGHEFDCIAASPPCQAHTAAQTIWKRQHRELIPATRDALRATGVPWVIENVPGAPLRADLTLCGTMFGLGVPAKRGYLQRHRLFEFWAPLLILLPVCAHPPGWRSVGVHGHTGGTSTGSSNHGWTVADWREAMQIPWMTRDELAQSLPPAYTELIGAHLMTAVLARRAAA